MAQGLIWPKVHFGQQMGLMDQWPSSGVSLNLKNEVHNKENKSTACGCQCSVVGCLIKDEKSMSKKGHNSEKVVFRIVSLDRMDCSLNSKHIL